jgi:hypothetical protein
MVGSVHASALAGCSHAAFSVAAFHMPHCCSLSVCLSVCLPPVCRSDSRPRAGGAGGCARKTIPSLRACWHARATPTCASVSRLRPTVSVTRCCAQYTFYAYLMCIMYRIVYMPLYTYVHIYLYFDVVYVICQCLKIEEIYDIYVWLFLYFCKPSLR